MGGASKFETVKLSRWVARLPVDCRPVAQAWVRACAALAVERDLDDVSCARLREALAADVAVLVETLECAPAGKRSALAAAWAAFAPRWVARALGDVDGGLRSVAEGAAEKRAASLASNGRIVRARRTGAGAKRLLAMLDAAPGRVIRWEPKRLAAEMAPKARKDQPARVRDMAEALVAVGLATWDRTPTGKPWALARTDVQRPGSAQQGGL